MMYQQMVIVSLDPPGKQSKDFWTVPSLLFLLALGPKQKGSEISLGFELNRKQEIIL